MKFINRWIMATLLIAGSLLTACASKAATAEKIPPAKLDEIPGSEFKSVTLTEKAAQRLDIQTDTVHMEEMEGGLVLVIPYSAVLYGLNGETWAYTNPKSLVYIRQVIVIDHIDGDMAILSEGPEVGTPVVTVGASLLYGAEVGVSK